MTAGDDPIAKDAYDELADDYAEDVQTNPYNAALEFPATTSLIPDVDGTRVLDAGCGTGRYTEWLLERGADVVGVDVSDAMLEHAIDELGDRAEFHRASLEDPLEFLDEGTFGGVVSALALDYVKRWRRTFAEFARLLEPGGFVVFSVVHPLDAFPGGEEEDEAKTGTGDEREDANYFEIERRTKSWAVDVPYYRRPFSEILDPLLETGFRIETVLEPRPTDAFEAQWPERYETESKQPVFLCVRARYASS